MYATYSARAACRNFWVLVTCMLLERRYGYGVFGVTIGLYISSESLWGWIEIQDEDDKKWSLDKGHKEIQYLYKSAEYVSISIEYRTAKTVSLSIKHRIYALKPNFWLFFFRMFDLSINLLKGQTPQKWQKLKNAFFFFFWEITLLGRIKIRDHSYHAHK